MASDVAHLFVPSAGGTKHVSVCAFSPLRVSTRLFVWTRQASREQNVYRRSSRLCFFTVPPKKVLLRPLFSQVLTSNRMCIFSLHLSVEGIFSVAVWLLVFYTVVRCKRRSRDVKCDILTAYRPWREDIYPGGLWLISFWVNVLKCVSVAVCVKWKIIDIVFSTYVKHNLE